MTTDGYAAYTRRLGVLLAGVLLATCKPSTPTDPADFAPGSGEQRYSVTLEWNAPSEDAAGNPLDDLAGYRVHYRATSPANGAGARTVVVGDMTRATIDGVPAGAWYFGVTARDVSGNESGLSNELRIEVGP